MKGVIKIKLIDIEFKNKNDFGILDFYDYTRIILNDGRYEFRIIVEEPNWVGNEGEAVAYAAGNDRRFYIYINGAWVMLAWVTGGGPLKISKILDDDEDTKVDCEETTDEDKVRIDTGGTERVVVDSSGVDVKTGDLVVASGGKIGYEGISGDSYWKYNSGTTYMELYTNGELRLQV